MLLAFSTNSAGSNGIDETDDWDDGSGYTVLNWEKDRPDRPTVQIFSI
jgi:hypothetical protein